MFQLIQNYAQSEKRSNEAQWRVQETAPSQPLVNAVQETSYVNNSKIVVLIMIAKKKAKVKGK